MSRAIPKLYRVELGSLTFGVIVTGNNVSKILDAAPVAKWGIGKSWDSVRKYYEKRKAKIQKMKNF